MKKRNRIAAVLLAALLLLPLAVHTAAAVGEEQPYAYNFDVQKNPLPCPSPYEVRYRIDPGALGSTKLKNPQGMFVRNDALYLADTGNNRILQFTLTETEPTFLREIRQGEGWSLSAPEDVFADEDGTLYIADTGNRRVLLLDKELNLLREITRPDSAAFDTGEFKPQKLVATAGGRIYLQAAGVNKGLVEFNADGSFSGYLGASPVSFNFTDYIWKRYFSTDAQRAQLASFVPTEYNNVALDREGFLFVTTATFDVDDLNSEKVETVRRLNLKGKNILISNDERIIGDYTWTQEKGPSRFTDVTVLDNDVYYVLDATRNRIFAYDNQGFSLYVFGGYGTRSGYFQSPTALEHWGRDLLVLDSTSGLVTVMKETSYGSAISSAIENYNSGLYEASFSDWQEVLRRNGNYRFAYDGIGKIMLRNGDYQQALAYLKYARDAYYYSKAWKLYRKDWIERNLIYIVLGIGALVLTLTVVRVIRKEKEALRVYEKRRRDIASGGTDAEGLGV